MTAAQPAVGGVVGGLIQATFQIGNVIALIFEPAFQPFSQSHKRQATMPLSKSFLLLCAGGKGSCIKGAGCSTAKAGSRHTLTQSRYTKLVQRISVYVAQHLFQQSLKHFDGPRSLRESTRSYPGFNACLRQRMRLNLVTVEFDYSLGVLRARRVEIGLSMSWLAPVQLASR